MIGTWFWLYITFAVPIFLAISGVPLRLVLRSPDAGARASTVSLRVIKALGRRPASRLSCWSTTWHVKAFCERRQLAIRS